MLSSRLSERSATVVLPLVAKIGQARRVDGLEQDEAAATYCPIITKEMGLIDWRQRAIDVVRKVRALVEWPTAYTYLEGKMLKIYGVEEVSAGGDEPGLVRGLSKGGFIVTTGSGTVVVTDVQIENRKRVSGRDFANGYRDLVGKTLGM
jgi:methionyl-tRNA formyltransferase